MDYDPLNPNKHVSEMDFVATIYEDENAVMMDRTKYFNERSIWFEDHRDWRFSKPGEMDHDEIHSILLALLESWAEWADSKNIVYWIGHGTLLSWYWQPNQGSFPWDTDLDIQVPDRYL